MIELNACRHKEARTKKSDKTRVHFQCTKPNCEFCCHINKSSDGLFRVVKWAWHTCGELSQPKVKRSWVVERVKERLGEIEELRPKDLQRGLKTQLGVDVKDPAVREAVAKARKDKDAEEAAIDKLPGPFQALREQNPGTVTDIAIEQGRLKMAFMCPGPCAQARTHCPKIIALDGTHGTSASKGVVLVATALDGAGQIFPVALGFAPSESNESWRFFVQRLAAALGIHDTPLTVISDRCKGIDSGVSEFLPRAAHSFCAFHIRQNMAKYGKAAAGFVWKIANASTPGQYNELMAALRAISNGAHADLAKIPREHWVRAFFPLPRYGHVTSNIAESTNASLLKIRKCSPLKLFMKTIQKINATFAERREKYATANPADLADTIFAIVAKNLEDGRRLEARTVDGITFDVDDQPGSQASRIVNLTARTCTCMKFQDHGFPCAHACSAALKANVDYRTLCIDERRVGSLQAVYRVGIIPVDIETIEPVALLPPLVVRQAGRPMVNRIRRKNEDLPGRIYTCGLCAGDGHTKKTCPHNYA